MLQETPDSLRRVFSSLSVVTKYHLCCKELHYFLNYLLIPALWLIDLIPELSPGEPTMDFFKKAVGGGQKPLAAEDAGTWSLSSRRTTRHNTDIQLHRLRRLRCRTRPITHLDPCLACRCCCGQSYRSHRKRSRGPLYQVVPSMGAHAAVRLLSGDDAGAVHPTGPAGALLGNIDKQEEGTQVDGRSPAGA